MSKAKRARRPYKFVLQRSWLTMPDGIRLATTIYMPRAKTRGEKFPVLLEILPYRKDEAFHLGDYPAYSYFAQHGFITVKVDIRGTGASEGRLPEREYSDIELADAEEIIRQLSELSQSNGNVAMWGTSWSGFNSLQVAMRRPPALKTIVSIHASDDLYTDDVHYTDGVLHVDPYHLFINHENGLPRTTDYRLDEDYFKNRFNRPPWLLTYLNQPLDGDFWLVKSLKEDYSRINIPVYLIGGLLDGYRSAMVRIFENLDVPLRCEVGPWDHSCPDDGSPGPNYEYMDRMISWLNHWMRAPQRAVQRELDRGKEMLVFLRSGHEPDATMEMTPGSWRRIPWPADQSRLHLFPGANGRLTKRAGAEATRSLRYTPGTGVTAGQWWGDTTGDTAADAAGSLVFDSGVLDEAVPIVGWPSVSLKVQSDAARANWSARLEDVGPDGTVSLITGAMINSAHRVSRTEPSLVVPGEPYQVTFNLHFTSWTFQPGHRIRLLVSNAQFPLAWPSAEPMTTAVHCGPKTRLTLPVVSLPDATVPKLRRVKEKLGCPDGEYLDSVPRLGAALSDGKPVENGKSWTHNPATGETSYTIRNASVYKIRGRRFDLALTNCWTTNDREPWNSRYHGDSITRVSWRGSEFTLHTTMTVESDKTHFHVRVTRVLSRKNKVIKRRTWRKSIRRQFQ